ncbi:MacA family efflux pump subunit, partial [Acinetobacter baumannii]|nr:MacA family efflux pump subunit [Acinetobacter baumannii]
SEADIMKVEKGQQVYFTTLGDETKRYATLRQIEPAPDSISSESNSTTSSTTSSAVYYNALFDVPNTDGKLRIDMTAQVYIVLNSAKNALLVPSSALSSKQFSGQRKQGQSADKASSTPSAERKHQGNGARLERLNLTPEQKQLIEQGKATLSVVRVLQADGTTKPTQILVGINNRVNAQVLAGLKQGDQVVIADSSENSAASANSGNNRRRGPMGM